MKGIISKLFLFALIVVLYWGCKKPETFPVIPSIEFRSINVLKYTTGKDSITQITVSFTDGDGDIGFADGDTVAPFNHGSPYYKDFIVSLFEKQNNQWVEATALECDTCVGFSARLPYLTPEGPNKTLKGEITMDQFLSPFPHDTIHYTVFIYDRALHKSNTITTADVIVNAN